MSPMYFLFVRRDVFKARAQFGHLIVFVSFSVAAVLCWRQPFPLCWNTESARCTEKVRERSTESDTHTYTRTQLLLSPFSYITLH